jgi:hypothetical protein
MTKRIQNTTLSPVQLTVLAGLLAGQTITAAAAAAGIGRAAVHTWLRDDFAFRAAYNRDRAELRRENVARLERLAAKAVDVLEAALEGGDVKAAIELTKRLGLLVPPTVGSDDAGELADEAEAKAAEHKAAMKQRAVFAGMGIGL